MPSVSTAYGEIYYAETGKNHTENPTIILVHGASGNHLAWPKALRRIEGWRVIAPDLPAHGKSSGDACDTVDAYAEAIGMMIQTLDIASAIVIGHSMGGAIAQTVALQHPQKVAGTVLIGTGAYLTVNDALLETIQQDFEKAASLMSKWSWGPSATDAMRSGDKQQILSNPSAVVYQDYVACSRFDVRNRLNEIECPVLIVGGHADKMTPLNLSQDLHAAIKNSTLKTIENGGHMMMLEFPEDLYAHLADWLQEHF